MPTQELWAMIGGPPRTERKFCVARGSTASRAHARVRNCSPPGFSIDIDSTFPDDDDPARGRSASAAGRIAMGVGNSPLFARARGRPVQCASEVTVQAKKNPAEAGSCGRRVRAVSSTAIFIHGVAMVAFLPSLENVFAANGWIRNNLERRASTAMSS